MWEKTGLIPDSLCFLWNALTSSGLSGLELQVLGFRVNIWKAVHPRSWALSKAWSMEPDIET